MLTTLLLAATIDVAVAQRAFSELDAMCREDAKKTWGVSLCGPIVFADPRTREAVAWKDGKLTMATLPKEIAIANTAVQWNGGEWTMLMWPLPQEDVARRAMLAHESFHRVQKQLGFPATGPASNHLDTVDGRVLMRLEWRALSRALSYPASARESILDALAFRERRHELFATAAEEERQLEMHEGLAQHTGYALAARNVSTRAIELAKLVAANEQEPSFVRGFAYTSGPLWGALLDRKSPGWTRRLQASDDLAMLAARAYGLQDAAGGGGAPLRDVEEAATRYRGAEVFTAEKRRDDERQSRLRTLRANLIDGPLLILPLQAFQMTMDPNGLTPLDDRGAVYRSITIRDQWGSIEAKDALLAADYKSLIVPANGDGWTLTLNEGWRKTAGKRAGDFTLTK